MWGGYQMGVVVGGSLTVLYSSQNSLRATETPSNQFFYFTSTLIL